MIRVLAVLPILFASTIFRAEATKPRSVNVLCHRTANEDLPENTLESLEQAALLGCDVVEIDLRRTLDGKIVLNHDGVLERLTDGVGDTEKTYFGDLQLRDAGSWMGDRFSGLHIALFEDALRLARERHIQLFLDIKTKGIGAQVLELLKTEGMLQRVRFGGDWADVKQLYPQANAEDVAAWVQPGVTAQQVTAYHSEGKTVVANFSANHHGMDLEAMKAAVAAGVDGINVDYPRLGAEAVGRPVEGKLQQLTSRAQSGESGARAQAILELARYRGFPLQKQFTHWLMDADDQVSRAAALALVTARPPTPVAAFADALHANNPNARANAAWALGQLDASTSTLLPLLQDKHPSVLQQVLLALERAHGDTSADLLLPLLSHPDPAVRGSAALALAYHQPLEALRAVPAQLHTEMRSERVIYDDHISRGKPQFTSAEIAQIMASFRCQMKMIQAISKLDGAAATHELEAQAFRASEDFSQMNGVVAAFRLWDRIGTDAKEAVRALGSTDSEVADKAEWMLVQGGPAVLPQVREALRNDDSEVRERAIRIVAWQGDIAALAALRAMRHSDPTQAALAAWAVSKIESLNPGL